ncbi:hypothetical protein NL676_014685 [Syzygium grande]|nr:hypothetical protein NL676_014685 [Syzygium grande]
MKLELSASPKTRFSLLSRRLRRRLTTFRKKLENSPALFKASKKAQEAMQSSGIGAQPVMSAAKKALASASGEPHWHLFLQEPCHRDLRACEGQAR